MSKEKKNRTKKQKQTKTNLPANSESTTFANAPFAWRHATCVAATRFIPSTIGVTTQTSAMQCSAQRSASDGSERRWMIALPRPGVAYFPLIRPTMVSMFSSTVWCRCLFARATCAAKACECCPPSCTSERVRISAADPAPAPPDDALPSVLYRALSVT